MRYTNRLIAVAVFAVTVATIAAQTPAQTATDSKAWKQPKTPWGDPDLQGVWPSQNMIGTPLERDRKLGTRAVLNDEEYAKRVAQQRRGDFSGTLKPEGKFSIAGGWAESGKANRQASMIVEPADGRIPALTADAQAREAARKAHWNAKKDSPDTWLDLTTWDRCITLGPIGSIIPSAYDSGQEIVQGPGYVVFRSELIHEARVISLDGRPHASPEVRSYMGDSRGHWEGNTLVVETTNFNGKIFVGGQGGGFGDGGAVATDQLRLTERFTRVAEDTIRYEVTINDPQTWTAPWKISMRLQREANYEHISEYACHEGNVFMHDALAGARATENKISQAGVQKGLN